MNEIREYVLNNCYLVRDHDISHSDRVYENGLRLAAFEGANEKVIKYFAYLHDSCRLSENGDPDHGERAVALICTLRNSILSELTDEEIEQLKTACRLHTNTLRTDEITVNCCFDADRIDLIRLNIKLEPERFATDTGKLFAETLNEKHTKHSTLIFRGGVTDEEFSKDMTNRLWTTKFLYAEHIHNARLTQDLLDGIRQKRRIIYTKVETSRIKIPLIQMYKHDLLIDGGVMIDDCRVLRCNELPEELLLPPEATLALKYGLKFGKMFGKEMFVMAYLKNKNLFDSL